MYSIFVFAFLCSLGTLCSARSPDAIHQAHHKLLALLKDQQTQIIQNTVSTAGQQMNATRLSDRLNSIAKRDLGIFSPVALRIIQDSVHDEETRPLGPGPRYQLLETQLIAAWEDSLSDSDRQAPRLYKRQWLDVFTGIISEDVARLDRLGKDSPIYKETPIDVRIFRGIPRERGPVEDSDRDAIKGKGDPYYKTEETLSKGYFAYRSMASKVEAALKSLKVVSPKKGMESRIKHLKNVISLNYLPSVVLGERLRVEVAGHQATLEQWKDLQASLERWKAQQMTLEQWKDYQATLEQSKDLQATLDKWKGENVIITTDQLKDRVAQFKADVDFFKERFRAYKKMVQDAAPELGISLGESVSPHLDEVKTVLDLKDEWKGKMSTHSHPSSDLHAQIIEGNSQRVDELRLRIREEIRKLSDLTMQIELFIDKWTDVKADGRDVKLYRGELNYNRLKVVEVFKKLREVKAMFQKLLRLTRLAQRDARSHIREAKRLYLTSKKESDREVYKAIIDKYEDFSYRLNSHEFGIQNEHRLINGIVGKMDRLQQTAVNVDPFFQLYSPEGKELREKALKKMVRPKRLKGTLGQDLDSKFIAMFKYRRVKALVTVLFMGGIAATLWALFDGYTYESGVRG